MGPDGAGEGARRRLRNPDRGDSLEEEGDLATLQRWAAARGVGRRRFLRLLGGGGVAAVLAACEAVPSPGEDDTGGSSAEAGVAARPWVKDPAPFIQHPTNLETRLEELSGVITPNDRFFVRNHVPTPRLDPTSYRLRIEGEGVEETVEWTYDELRGLPSRTVVAYIECAGNWRGLWPEVSGTRGEGTQWGRGGVSCASWTGPSLARILEPASLWPEAVDVNLVGLDTGEFQRPMPVEKALDPDTILAHSMNGADLPPDHGYPIRGIVPGWVGSSSVKWLGRIEVSTERTWTPTNTTSYVLVGPEWPAEEFGPAEGGPITLQNVKSALALPRPARLRPEAQWIQGFAYSPHAPIDEVEWSADGGRSWRSAELLSPPLRWAWRSFAFRWDPSPGDYELRVRARDREGNGQPGELPFNEKGYLLNVPVEHPVQVG